MPGFLSRLQQILRWPSGPTLIGRLDRLEESEFEIRLALGRLAARLNRTSEPRSLADAEFRVFSQFGEDGIIQYLISKVYPLPNTFVEFGVHDYTEANTLFLLLHDNWRGLIMDGSDDAMKAVRSRELYWRQDLTAVGAFIDRDNINSLLETHGFTGEIGLLSIDIDGNDYWVWERINVVNPVLVVAEYNSVFGPHRAVSVPYDPIFQRSVAHSSNLYWGCSLKALCMLAERKGYAFVGSNRAGNNAFFVRNDRLGSLKAFTAEEGYVESRFRESRDDQRRLTYISGSDRFQVIAHLPLIDVADGRSIQAGELA